MASNSNPPQKTPSEQEEEFLKRFSLRKFTVPSEKPKEFPNAFNGSNSGTLKESATPQKRYRIEYKKLSSVMKTVGPWWLQSRGLQEHMSSEILVTLVEDTPKKIYGSQFPTKNDEQISLCSYHKDKGASNANHQIDIMFSARNYAETRSVNGFSKSNISHFSKLRDVDCVEDRVGRLLSFLNNFGYDRLRSGCEYCDKGQDGRSEKTQVSLLADKSDIVSNLNLCVCALEVIDAEIEDVSRCLESMMRNGQCNYHCAIKRLHDLRRPLREVIMNVQCQADSTKQLKEIEEKTNVVSFGDPIGSTDKIEKQNSKRCKFWCVPRRTASEKNVRGDHSSKPKKKSKKSDLDSENDDSSPTREDKSSGDDNPAQNKTDLDSDSSPTRGKRGMRRRERHSKDSKSANKQNDQEGEQEDITGNQTKSKLKNVDKKKRLQEEDNLEQNQALAETSRFQRVLQTTQSNYKNPKSATSKNQIKEHNECTEKEHRLQEHSSECQRTDSEADDEEEEEEYYVANKQCQTNLQSQPIYVPFFIYDEGSSTQHRNGNRYGNQNRNRDLNEDCAIKVCQDKRNHRSTRECDPNRRNRYQNRDEDSSIKVCHGRRNRRSSKHCDSSGQNRFENRDEDYTIGICEDQRNGGSSTQCESRNNGPNFDSYSAQFRGRNEVSASFAQEIRPCYCSQCRCRRNFRGGAEIVENDDIEFVQKRRRRNSAHGKCSCGCGCSALPNSTKCTEGIDEHSQKQSGKSSNGEVIETYRETSQRKEIIERDKDNIMPVRKSVTIKKETEENYYYPSEEENTRRSIARDESRNQCDKDDPRIPCSRRKSRRSSRKIRECELDPSGAAKQRAPVCQRRKSRVEKSNQDMDEQDVVEGRLSRTEIIEEKRIERKSTAEGSVEEVESNHMLKKKMSKVQIVEDRSPFEMRANTDERRSIRKSLRPTEDVIEYEKEFNPKLNTRTSRTEILEERKSLSNRRNDGAMNADEYSSVEKRSSRIEITEDNRAPYTRKKDVESRRSIRKSLLPSDDIIQNEYDVDPKLKTRSSRTEIVEQRAFSSNKRNDEALITDDGDMAEYDSVERRTSRVIVTELNRPPDNRKISPEATRSIRKSLIQNDFKIQDEDDFDATLKKRTSRTEIIEERKFLSNMNNDERMDLKRQSMQVNSENKYDSLRKRGSKTEITECKRPSQKKSISKVCCLCCKCKKPKQCMNDIDENANPSLNKKSSRIEIVEERTFLSNKNNDEAINPYDRDLDEYNLVQRRTSRIVVTELNSPPDNTKRNTEAHHSIRKSLIPSDYNSKNEYEEDPKLKKRSSRTEIVEERTFLSNKRNDDLVNSDDRDMDDFNSIQKRSSRTEIKEVYGPPSKRKSNVEMRQSIRKSLIPSDDIYNKKDDRSRNIDDHNIDKYDLVQKRTSRSEIKEFYGPLSRKKSKIELRQSIRKSLIPSKDEFSKRNLDEQEDIDEYNSVQKRSSRIEMTEVLGPPSKRKSIAEARRSIRRSLTPNEDMMQDEYDVDSKLKKRSSRTDIVEERTFLFNKRNKEAMNADDGDLDEYDSIQRRASRVITDISRSPSNRKNMTETRHSIRKSLIPNDDMIQDEDGFDPTLKKRMSRTEIVEERKFLSKNRNDERINTDNRDFNGNAVRHDSDTDFFVSAQKRSSRVEIRNDMLGQSYSMIEMSEERRSKRKVDDDVSRQKQPQCACTCLLTADKCCGTDLCEERKLKTDCCCKCSLRDPNRNNGCCKILDIKPKCQESQTIAVCKIEDEEEGCCSLSAMQTGGQLQAQLELKIHGGKCNTSDIELCKPTHCPVGTFCCNCYGKNVPIVEKDIAKEIRKLIGNRERNSVFLKFTIVEDLYHIQISTDNEYLGCLYATECAILEARSCNAFDGYITLSVTESWNSKSQIEKLVDHAFVVVRRENGNC